MNFKTLLLISLAMLGITELFLRLAISMPSTQQYDSQLGYTNIPGSKMIESQEGYSHIKFNKIGFNDDNPDDSLPRKVFVIGDSYTEAFQVPITRGYVGLLQDEFKEKGIDIIKLARDSFWPIHYPIISSRFYNRFKPEFTIIQTGSHTLTDLYGGNLSIDYSENGEITDYRYHVSDDDAKKESLRLILNNSALAYYLLRKYKYLIKKILKRLSSIKNFIGPAAAYSEHHKEPYPIEDIKKRLIYVLSKIPGKIVVMYLPSPGLNINKGKSSDEVRDIIKSSSKTLNIDFIDLTAAFRKDFSQNNHRYLNGFANSKPWTGHLNKNGHQLVADTMAETLNRMGYLK